MTVVYLAGPMRGIEAFNAPAFDEVERLVRNDSGIASVTVFNPAANDAEKQPNWDPKSNSLEGFDLKAAFAWDLEKVCKSNLVLCLPGWRESQGSNIEVSVARMLDIPVYELDTIEDARSRDLWRETAVGSAPFHSLLRSIAHLHDRKQADYGTDTDPFANVRSSAEFGVPPWVGAVVRMNDKVNRIKSFIANGSLKNEPISDSFLDISVYSLIALLLFQEEIACETSSPACATNAESGSE